MNDELQKQLAAMLQKLTEASSSATAWVGEQVPPLVHEKIIFGRVNETIQLLICVVALWYCLRLARFCYHKTQDSRNDDVGWIAGMCLTSVGAIISFLAGCDAVTKVGMVWFAPRLYVVEWLHGMVTK